MRTNLFIKIFSSLLLILIALYFYPALGICLILLRSFIYREKNISTPISLISIGCLILIPKCADMILKLINFDVKSIPYLSQITSSTLYNNEIINYSKRLFIVGVIFLIIGVILKRLSYAVSRFGSRYIRSQIHRDTEIAKQNDMTMKIKQEKSRNSCYVRCSNCGGDNIIYEKVGTCKFCRSMIENKNYKN